VKSAMRDGCTAEHPARRGGPDHTPGEEGAAGGGYGRGADRSRAARQAAGGTPSPRLKARLKAASDS
jgi:hypothetical protein